jgi:N-methylhydantoinase B/oxoprolinase/acetone carboxylase alpha subunit
VLIQALLAGVRRRRVWSHSRPTAHHARRRGPTPGSMPAASRALAEEGVVIEPRVLDDDAIAAS